MEIEYLVFYPEKNCFWSLCKNAFLENIFSLVISQKDPREGLLMLLRRVLKLLFATSNLEWRIVCALFCYSEESWYFLGRKWLSFGFVILWKLRGWEKINFLSCFAKMDPYREVGLVCLKSVTASVSVVERINLLLIFCNWPIDIYKHWIFRICFFERDEEPRQLKYEEHVDFFDDVMNICKLIS